VQAVAQANLIQPRDRATREPTCVGCGCRVFAKATKTIAVGVETVDGTRLVRRGPGDGMHEQTRRSNWGPTRPHKVRTTKKISGRKTASGSDEAIVSDDLAGQHNRSASQGPLDRIARWCLVPRPYGPCPSGPPVEEDERRSWPCISWCQRRSRLNSCLKPYWGKPAVRNFRGGGGNTGVPKCVSQTLNGHWASSLVATLCASSLLGGYPIMMLKSR
jgi:hypothetical protein